MEGKGEEGPDVAEKVWHKQGEQDEGRVCLCGAEATVIGVQDGTESEDGCIYLWYRCEHV
jgi:hypothetical protein